MTDSATFEPSVPAVRPARTAAYLFADTGVRAITALVVGALVARHLGPAGFGQFATAVALVTVLGALATLGTDSLFMQRSAALGVDSPETGRLIGTAAVLRAVGAVAAAVAALLIAGAAHGSDTGLAILAVVPALLATPFETGWLWLVAAGRVGGVVAIRIALALGFAAARVVAIRSDGGVAIFALLTGLDLLLPAVASAVVARRSGAPRSTRRPSPADVRRLFRDSLPLLLGGVFYLVMLRVDLLLVRALLGETDAGGYGAITRISEATTLLPIVVVSAVAPRIAADHAIGSSGYDLAYRRLIRSLAVASVVIAAVVSIGSTVVLRLLVGSEYLPFAGVLAVHVWSTVAIFVATGRERMVVDFDITRTALFNTTIGAALNIGLNLVLIPTVGLVGAAWATVISYLAIVSIVPLLDRRQRPVNQRVLAAVGITAPSA